MLVAALLLLSAESLASAGGPLELPCGWGGASKPTKDMTELTLGYIYGYAEARGNRSVWRDQVQLAEQIDAICQRQPKTLLKDIAREILRKKGIVSEPTNGQR